MASSSKMITLHQPKNKLASTSASTSSSSNSTNNDANSNKLLLLSGGEKDIDKNTGAFVRKPSLHRNRFLNNGGDGPFSPEGNQRYHLFVSYACPWCTRILLTLNIKGLKDHIAYSVAHPNYQDLGDGVDTKGWVFQTDGDYQNYATSDLTLRDVYLRSDPDFIGKWTVPCLYDTKTSKIVNNESGDIMAMLNGDLNHLTTCRINLRPSHISAEIERMADWLYPINDGVYQCGFARTQQAYDKAATLAASRLDACDELLNERAYIAGNVFSEADLRLFATLVRWDSIYFVHFKCCFRRIQDYPNLSRYVRQIYANDLIRKDIPFEYIRTHYFQDHLSINPFGITPMGPFVDLDAPHDRGEIIFSEYESDLIASTG